MTRLVSCAAAFIVVLGLTGCPSSKPAKAPAPTEPAMDVKAGDLLNEYGTNAVAADAKYKGKVLRVTGKFGSAQKVPLGAYAVQLLPEDASDLNLSGVQCFILDLPKRMWQSYSRVR
jgi:tRNA_anti-like